MKHPVLTNHSLTYQVFADILRLHPAFEVSDGMVQLIGHYLNLRQDGLKFWLMCKERKNKGKLVHIVADVLQTPRIDVCPLLLHLKCTNYIFLKS